jgi:hypothetical protein
LVKTKGTTFQNQPFFYDCASFFERNGVFKGELICSKKLVGWNDTLTISIDVDDLAKQLGVENTTFQFNNNASAPIHFSYEQCVEIVL